MERAAFFSALASKKLKGVCFCTIAIYGNASTRLAENVPATGFAYGGWPDVDELYKQLTETDPKKRGEMLHRAAEDPARADPVRGDLRLFLGQRHRAARRGRP